MRMNLFDDEGWLERTHPPPKEGFEWRRKRVSGEQVGASLYELPPGQRTFPYHYELGNDELMIRWGPAQDERLWFRRSDAANYREGEASE